MAEESNNPPTSEAQENVTEDRHTSIPIAEESNNPPTSEAHENVTEEVSIVIEEGDGAPKDAKVDYTSMELDTGGQAAKRAREDKEEDLQHTEGNGDGSSKKPRLDKEQNGEEEPVKEAVGAGEEEEGAEEDDGLQKEGGEGAGGGEENEGGDGGEAKKEEEKKVGPVKLGPKIFNTSVEMFDYFYKFLHHWPLNVNANKYEHMVLLDLLLKGHHESDKKVGPGVEAFQVKVHPMWQSRCYCLIRKDGTVDDFSYRKCVDTLIPLPENMKVTGTTNFPSNDRRNHKQSKQGHQGGWGGGRGGGGGGGGGGGRGGGWGGGRGGGGRGRGRHGRGRGQSKG